MKKTSSIFLFLLLTFSIFLKLGIVLQWKMNQDYIAKNLCVNIDKPQMGCRGKCQLDRRLQKADAESKQEAPSSAQKIKVTAIDLFLTERRNENLFLNFAENSTSFYSYIGSQYTYSFATNNFKPPVSIV